MCIPDCASGLLTRPWAVQVKAEATERKAAASSNEAEDRFSGSSGPVESGNSKQKSEWCTA